MPAPPPIPARLAHRPTVGGLVVPYVSIEHADGHILGAVQRSRMIVCVNLRLCQIDGEPLDARVVVFARQRDLDAGWTAEPGMHPECAAYSAKACPMVAGHMAHYRTHPVNLDRAACNVPGCGCAGFVSADDDRHRAGQPAERYFALWIALADYTAAVDDRTGEVIGVGLRGVPILRRRPLGRDAQALTLLTKGAADGL